MTAFFAKWYDAFVMGIGLTCGYKFTTFLVDIIIAALGHMR